MVFEQTQGAFLIFNHLIDYWIWRGFALIAYLDDWDLGDHDKEAPIK